jgi:hypothetical protein
MRGSRPPHSLPVTVIAAFLSVACAVGCTDHKDGPKPAASAAPAKSAEPPTRTVRLQRQPALIGEKRHTVRTSELTLSVEFWQDSEKLGTSDSHRKETYDRTFEVTGLVGGDPAKGSVHYDGYQSVETAPNKPAVDSTALLGKSYLLDATDGTLTVKSAGGKAVSKEESDTLHKFHGELGKPDPIIETIGDAPITLGQPLTMRKELLRALLTSESGELKSGRIWLAEMRTVQGREAAVFQWTADTKSTEENGLEITWHMSGDAVIALAPAVTLSTTLKGSLDVGGETYQRGARVTMAGAGTIVDTSTLVVTPP